MSRPLLALALVAGVAFAPTVNAEIAPNVPITKPRLPAFAGSLHLGPADSAADSAARPVSKSKTATTKTTKKSTAKTTKKTTAKATKKSKTSKTAKKKARSKKAKKAKQELIARTPTKSSLRSVQNMPHGYAWPPTAQMLASEKSCETKLVEAGITWKPAEPEGRIVDAITIADDAGTMTLGGIVYRSAYRKGPHKLDCQLALALEGFGKDLYALGVREIKFGSIYRWTNVRVNGETKNILSRHALGIAMDIVSFTDDTGREANVEKDYPNGDPLLLAVESAVTTSGRFRVLLTPKNDPISHHDHFHLEVAVDYTRVDHTASVP